MALQTNGFMVLFSKMDILNGKAQFQKFLHVLHNTVVLKQGHQESIFNIDMKSLTTFLVVDDD